LASGALGPELEDELAVMLGGYAICASFEGRSQENRLFFSNDAFSLQPDV
jgi:hypothetical protein